MLTGISQSLIMLLVMVAFYTADFVLIARYDKQRRASGSGRSWDYTLMLIAAGLFIAVQPTLLPWQGIQIDGGWGLWIQAAGLLLIIGAVILHLWARLHLQQFYAERVELQPQHQLVSTGPYTYVRHPIFTSFFMFAGGLLLINPAIPTLLLAAYTLWDFSRAAAQEEKLLRENLPGYAEYTARTGRFFPPMRRWSKGR